jgi:hypothetical protein
VVQGASVGSHGPKRQPLIDSLVAQHIKLLDKQARKLFDSSFADHLAPTE